MGFLGGLVGAAVAAAVVVLTAAVNGWTAVLYPGWIAVGPLIGMAVGLSASAYPAHRAAAISPALERYSVGQAVGLQVDDHVDDGWQFGQAAAVAG